MIAKYQNLTQAGTKKNFRFLVYDLNKQAMIYESVIYFNKLIGMLKSGLYTFVNGYMYYNNNVIKLRYDLIETPNSY